MVQFASIGRQRRLRLLKRPDHRAVELSSGGLSGCARRADTRMSHGEVGKGPGHQRAEAEREACVSGKSGGWSAEIGGSSQRHLRVELCGLDPYRSRRRSELTLGLTQVRPTADERGTIADRERPLERRPVLRNLPLP